MARLFGTDGVRGVANTELTPEMAYRLGRAAAIYFMERDGAKSTILIGRDTRISGTMFESALSAGICSAGGEAVIVGVIPTPAVAYLTAELELSSGIVVSASHNPFGDNGIKFFGGDGYKLPDQAEDEIEAIVRKMEREDDFYRPSGAAVGVVEYRRDLVKNYVNHVLATADYHLGGMRVALDCANGAAHEVMPDVLRRLGADVTVLHAAPYGTNINDGCGSTHLESLREAVKESGADIGIAHDGDADRCLCVDERGGVMDGDHILAIIGLDMMKKGALPKKTIVTTVMANIGFHQAIRRAGGAVEVTRVGDRYVLERMISGGFALGGEQSGHIIFGDLATTGDGLITALMVLGAMVRSGRRASELNSLMTSYPQLLVNVVVKSRDGWHENANVTAAIREAEEALGEAGRILVRPSGTEPLIRVMAEGPDEKMLEVLCESVADVVRRELG